MLSKISHWYSKNYLKTTQDGTLKILVLNEVKVFSNATDKQIPPSLID
jgi:hypothetical protein